MQKFARMVSLCLLFVFATDTFAKAANPMRHAAGTAEARLVMESLQNRILSKFERSSVSEKESIFYGLYRLSVKAQNKIQNMDMDKIAEKLNRRKAADSQSTSVLTDDEQAAAEFMGDAMNVETNATATIDGSMVSGVVKSSAKSLADLGTPVDSSGKFKALKKAQLLSNISHLTGDGDWDGLAQALIIIVVGFLVLLAIVSIAIIGASFAAFGVPGAVIAIVVVGVSLVILFTKA